MIKVISKGLEDTYEGECQCGCRFEASGLDVQWPHQLDINNRETSTVRPAADCPTCGQGVRLRLKVKARLP